MSNDDFSYDDFSHVVVTFGIHRGKTIESVPSDYLKWLSEKSYNDSIATAADKEWRFREKFDSHQE